jgi:4'-phosphopantetheinyl transferase
MTTLRFADPGDPDGDVASRALNGSDVDVWAFSVAAAAPDAVQRWSRLLSADEREHGARFLRASDRDAYVVVHGVMRRVLASYCGIPPAALTIGRASGGKPRLEFAGERGDVRFNLAHSGACALLAVGRGEIGIDVEVQRDDIEALSLADRFFFGDERAAIVAAAREARARTFFRYWVAKESVLKAQGVGLAFPLDGFSIEFGADGDTATVRSSDRIALSDAWRVRMLPVPSGWHAALAAAGDGRVRFRNAAVDG